MNVEQLGKQVSVHGRLDGENLVNARNELLCEKSGLFYLGIVNHDVNNIMLTVDIVWRQKEASRCYAHQRAVSLFFVFPSP